MEEQYKNDVAADGPFKLTMELYYKGHNGESATASYSFQPGLIPTRRDFQKAVTEIETEVQACAATNLLRLTRMTRHAFVTMLMEEHTSIVDMRLSVPGPDQFTLDRDLCDG